MGIEKIIYKFEDEASVSDDAPNGPFFDDSDPPVIIATLSDSFLSDTESFSELEDAADIMDVQEINEFNNDLPSELSLLADASCDSSPREAYNVERSLLYANHTQSFPRTKTTSRRSKMGKKKARRFENARQLDLLVGDDVSDDNDFMPGENVFKFTQILSDKDLVRKILNTNINDTFVERSISKDYRSKKVIPRATKTKKLTAEVAFNNLTVSEKSFFRRRNLPLGMLQYLETCVVSFFENNPTGIYVSESTLSSYERMMLHSLAHYYDLNSLSFDLENGGGRSTKVTNYFNFFNPPHLCLSQYLIDNPRGDDNLANITAKKGRVRRRSWKNNSH